MAEHLLLTWGPREESDAQVYAALARSRSVFYKPTVGSTVRELRHELPRLFGRVDACTNQHITPKGVSVWPHRGHHSELIIIDEAERLSTSAIEYMRDLFDRHGMGLILIGMPAFEKRMARYPQLNSRVRFTRQYRPLGPEKLSFVLTRRWRELGLDLDQTDFTDAHAVAAIVRIKDGNFRLVQRLFVQIERILKITG